MIAYRSGLTDSSRWQRVALRPDDIVISAPSKCGNTWLQMICALLIFRSPRLPAPLTALSPWVDMRLRPLDDLRAALDGQRHRRFLKTHTPLDGLPAVPGVTYLVIGRDPRDVAVSMDHHRANLDDDRISALLDVRAPDRPQVAQRERVLRWIHDERPAVATLDSLRGVVAHLEQAWERRHDPAVVLVHYADLRADLERGMRSLAERLRIAVPDASWPQLVEAAGFGRMRERATELAPDEGLGLFTDSRAFFRSGAAGQWRTILTAEDVRGYESLLRSIAPPDLVDWLEHGGADAAHESGTAVKNS